MDQKKLVSNCSAISTTHSSPILPHSLGAVLSRSLPCCRITRSLLCPLFMDLLATWDTLDCLLRDPHCLLGFSSTPLCGAPPSPLTDWLCSCLPTRARAVLWFSNRRNAEEFQTCVLSPDFSIEFQTSISAVYLTTPGRPIITMTAKQCHTGLLAFLTCQTCARLRAFTSAAPSA